MSKPREIWRKSSCIQGADLDFGGILDRHKKQLVDQCLLWRLKRPSGAKHETPAGDSERLLAIHSTETFREGKWLRGPGS
jgi:hypothetical protein